ncbi:hypothetical protein FQZ97_1179330 [compost metagenome]
MFTSRLPFSPAVAPATPFQLVKAFGWSAPPTSLPSTLPVREAGVPFSLRLPLSGLACGRSSTISMLTLAEALARPSLTVIRKPSVSGPVASVVASVRV